MTPVNPLITLAGTRRMNGRVRFLGGQNKNVDEVLAARIDQSGDILAAENIQSPADERKSFIREILHRGNKGELAIEPGLDGVLVRGSHVGKVAGLQGANVSVDDLSGSKGSRSGTILHTRPSIPRNCCDDQNRSGNGLPSPGGNPKRDRRRRSRI